MPFGNRSNFADDAFIDFATVKANVKHLIGDAATAGAEYENSPR